MSVEKTAAQIISEVDLKIAALKRMLVSASEAFEELGIDPGAVGEDGLTKESSVIDDYVYDARYDGAIFSGTNRVKGNITRDWAECRGTGYYRKDKKRPGVVYIKVYDPTALSWRGTIGEYRDLNISSFTGVVSLQQDSDGEPSEEVIEFKNGKKIA
jgi:hypothetical protein